MAGAELCCLVVTQMLLARQDLADPIPQLGQTIRWLNFPHIQLIPSLWSCILFSATALLRKLLCLVFVLVCLCTIVSFRDSSCFGRHRSFNMQSKITPPVFTTAKFGRWLDAMPGSKDDNFFSWDDSLYEVDTTCFLFPVSPADSWLALKHKHESMINAKDCMSL